MTLRTVSTNLFFFSSLFLFACGDADRKQEAQQQQRGGGGGQRPPVRAEAMTISTSVLLNNIEIPGTIVANEATEIRPEVAGLITGIYFKEGSYVSRGAMLFKLNDADLQAQLRKLQVQQRIARQNETRSEELLKIGGISRQDYDATVLQTSNTAADIAIIQTQIAKTAIRAPFSGKVGFRMVSVGAYVSPSTVMTTMSQTNDLKIDFTVPEKYIPQVKNGQFVNFTIEGTEKKYTGRIIATESNVTQNSRTLQVRAVVQGDAGGLTPGGFAKVILNFAPDPNAIMIPTQAVLPQARGKKVYVYQGGVAKFVDVETGIRDSATVQVTKGLNVGDTVLITGLLSLREGSKVVIASLNGKPVKPAGGQKPDSTKATATKQ
ncbi:MAG TPA: efflux RND transporter periplasmic adaptor subunit [Flavisolibacter sp.]|nr:efflux RND transporter periplasmic adaptor subunit [Flavisolibacter sp.]